MLYASVDEGYFIQKLNGIKEVVSSCEGYTTQDGRKVTKAIARKELKTGMLKVYEYTEDELEEAIENGSIRGVDWTMKIQSI